MAANILGLVSFYGGSLLIRRNLISHLDIRQARGNERLWIGDSLPLTVADGLLDT